MDEISIENIHSGDIIYEAVLVPNGDIKPMMKKIGKDTARLYAKQSMKLRGRVTISFTFDPDCLESLNKYLSRKKFNTVVELEDCINKYMGKKYPKQIGDFSG